jgi:hypothetical protein
VASPCREGAQVTRAAARVLLAERDLHARQLQASFLEEQGLTVELDPGRRR